jgi:hypothetical protein
MLRIYQKKANFGSSCPPWLLGSTTSHPAFFSRPLDLNQGPYRYHRVQLTLSTIIGRVPRPIQLSQKLPASPRLGPEPPHGRPCPDLPPPPRQGRVRGRTYPAVHDLVSLPWPSLKATCGQGEPIGSGAHGMPHYHAPKFQNSLKLKTSSE